MDEPILIFLKYSAGTSCGVLKLREQNSHPRRSGSARVARRPVEWCRWFAGGKGHTEPPSIIGFLVLLCGPPRPLLGASSCCRCFCWASKMRLALLDGQLVLRKPCGYGCCRECSCYESRDEFPFSVLLRFVLHPSLRHTPTHACGLTQLTLFLAASPRLGSFCSVLKAVSPA